MRKVRITFRSEIYLEGETLEDIKNEWYGTGLYDLDSVKNNGLEFVKVCSVEDAETYEDLEGEWNTIG